MVSTGDITPSPAGARQDTRGRLLDTASSLFNELGVEATSISQIIETSGHGRTTFYRYFKSLDEVLTQVVIRDFEQLIEDFERQRYVHDDPAVQIVEDMVWFFRQMRARQGLSLLFRDRDPYLYHRIGIAIEKFRDVCTTLSRPIWEEAARRARLREGVTLERYVEWVTFTLVSMLSNPFHFATDEFRLRDTLRDFFVPSLITDATSCVPGGQTP